MTALAQKQDTTNALSLTGKQWVLRGDGFTVGATLAKTLGIPEIVARILTNRDIGTHEKTGLDDAGKFLTPSLKDIPDPNHLLDMEKAVERLVGAIQNKQKIAIFGDYDVDGSCASALLHRYFASLGIEVTIYIPDRIDEGYGPSPLAMNRLKEQDTELVITVDCGCVAFEAMEEAKKLNLDVIITDHHQCLPEKPHAVALINPNRVDETSECTMLCGAGVAFYMVMALNRKLREIGFFNDEIKEPNLLKLLDLVAVANICDMVPLTGVNRALTDRGLKILSQQQNYGFQALCATADITEELDPYHAGFLIGPRINAGGRISACDLGANLLSTHDANKAVKIAGRLSLLNEERKNIEAAVLEEALEKIEKENLHVHNAIVVAEKGWHPGVIGIVASRIKAKYYKPTFVIALDEKGCKGSGRSIYGVDLGKAVVNCKPHLTAGGGHKMAAGISLEAETLDNFTEALKNTIAEQIQGVEAEIFTQKQKIDGFVTPAGINKSLMEMVGRCAPYGSGNPEPVFAINDATVQYAKAVGADGSHVTFTLKDNSGSTLRGIAFRAMESDIGPALLSKGKNLTFCGTIQKNNWQGIESYQLHLLDIFEGRWQG
jgi:single-stranded-DNA-specific exonuclease